MKNTASVIPLLNPEQGQTPNAAWPFQLDPVNLYAYWEKAFSDEECQKIIDIGNSKIKRKAKVFDDKKQGIRESEVSWLYSCDDMEWAYRRMTDIITNLNERFFKFDLFGACEGFQFTKYKAPGGKYGKHIDSSSNTLIRKLSFTLQLSDPSDYVGGDLCLHFGDEPKIMRRDRGYVAVFPSWVLHEVTPVTSGSRYSLVSWITGKPFQ